MVTWTNRSSNTYSGWANSTCGTNSAHISMALNGYANKTTEWNGVSWRDSNHGCVSNCRYRNQRLLGVTNSATAAGGEGASAPINSSESYNGIAWSADSNIGTARWLHAGLGTRTAGVLIAGATNNAQSTFTKQAEHFNGTSWSNGGTSAYNCTFCNGIGTQTAGLYCEGVSGTAKVATEEYDGSTFTAGGNLNTAAYGMCGGGTQTDGWVAFGNIGSNVNTARTEVYNGTSWTTDNNANTARRYLGGDGPSASNGLSLCGYTTAGTTICETFGTIVSADWFAVL